MKHGIVTSKEITDDGHLSLVVQSDRAGVTWPDVVVAQTQPGSVQNIEEGYHVAVEECDDGLMVCVGVLNTEPSLIPNSLNAQERSIKYDDGTEISTRLKEDGSYTVNIKASGDVTINADGDVTIGDAANAVKLAVQNHTHTTTLSDGSTATTSKPNEQGTETKVQ